MFRSLHHISALLFFALGLSFFVAYVLLKNGISMVSAAWWMQRMDLPLALATVLYGGTSLYRSLSPKDSPSRILAVAIGLPLIAFFIFLVVLNFWEILPLAQGEPLL